MSGKSAPLIERIAAIQIQGDRDYQEDSFRVLDMRETEAGADAALILLADGMGGHAGGAEASAVAIRKFSEAFRIESTNTIGSELQDALMAANDAIAAEVNDKPELAGMGCTFVAVCVKDNILYWASVGDSPLWLHRNGFLRRLNADHSMVPVLNAMVDAGELTAKQAKRDSRRNALRSALDGGDLELIDLQESGFQLQPRDHIILATDGLETLSNNQIENIVDGCDTLAPSGVVESLIGAVEDIGAPNQDNTTIVFLSAGPSATAQLNLSSTTKVQSYSDTLNGPRTEVRTKSGAGESSKLLYLALYALVGLAALIAIYLLALKLLERTTLDRNVILSDEPPRSSEVEAIPESENPEQNEENPVQIDPSPEGEGR